MALSTAISGAHLRVARPTDDIDALLPFYRDGLGFRILGEFKNHDGFDGVMLGLEDASYHIEFTRCHEHRVGKAPTQDNLLVFYLPENHDFKAAIQRMEDCGFHTAASFNPYWDHHGKTFFDPDGYGVVLANLENPTLKTSKLDNNI